MPEPTAATVKAVAKKMSPVRQSTIAQRVGNVAAREGNSKSAHINIQFSPQQIAVIDELCRALGGLRRAQTVRLALAELADRKGLSFG